MLVMPVWVGTRDNIVQVSHFMDEEISSKILSDFVWGKSMNQNLGF